MSWPADGKPRFVLVEHSGALSHAPTNIRTLENITCAILDRAFCHRTVAKYRSEQYTGGKGVTSVMARAKARAAAREKLAELNATHEEAVAA